MRHQQRAIAVPVLGTLGHLRESDCLASACRRDRKNATAAVTPVVPDVRDELLLIFPKIESQTASKSRGGDIGSRFSGSFPVQLLVFAGFACLR
jgi:hypothetical protein